MSFTPDQISSARKARGMTQEQLAASMNVSRQTVSHWENGRVQPDDETVERLCALLNMEAVPAPQKKRSAVRPFLLGLVCGVFLTLIAVFAFSAARPSAPAAESQTPKQIQTTQQTHPASSGADDRYTPAFYQQENIREEGKAHLVFSLVRDPITVIERDREPYVGWEVDYQFEEVSGVGFTMTSFTQVYFTAEGEITYSDVFKGEELSIPFDDVHVPANGRIRYNVFKPVDASVLYAACIEGVDDNGCERLFRYTIPLSQEIHE